MVDGRAKGNVPVQLKSALLNILTIFSSVALALLAAEIVLHFLPIAAALPFEPPSVDNPIQRYVPNRPFTWSFDWNMNHVVRGRSNAQGFLADYDYIDVDARPLVAVAGDSFMEALRVPFAQSLAGRLQSALGARGRAYVFAQSGSPLSQYVAYAQHACERYRPQRLVVSVVGNDFDQSVYAHRRRNGIFHLYPTADGGFDYKLTPLSPPGLAEQVLRQSALALYLMRNVGITNVIARFGFNMAQAQTTVGYVGQTDSDASPERIEEGYRVIDWFLRTLPQAACLQPRDIVLTVDTPRPHVYEADALASTRTSYFGLMRNRIIAQALAQGFKVVDTEPYFLKAYAVDRQPFELPTDGHWNAHGHEVVAAAVIEALADWMPLSAHGSRQARPAGLQPSQ